MAARFSSIEQADGETRFFEIKVTAKDDFTQDDLDVLLAERAEVEARKKATAAAAAKKRGMARSAEPTQRQRLTRKRRRGANPRFLNDERSINIFLTFYHSIFIINYKVK